MKQANDRFHDRTEGEKPALRRAALAFFVFSLLTLFRLDPVDTGPFFVVMLAGGPGAAAAVDQGRIRPRNRLGEAADADWAVLQAAFSVLFAAAVFAIGARSKQRPALSGYKQVPGAFEFAAAAQSSLNGLYIFDLTSTRYVYINGEYERLTGYSLEMLNSVSDFWFLFHPDDLPAVRKHVELMRLAEPGKTYEIEYRFRCSDGRWMWCHSREILLEKEDASSPPRYLGTFVDISERKTAEDVLRRSEDNLRWAIMGAGFPIMIHAEDGRITVVNHAWVQLSGYSRDELPDIEAWVSKAYGPKAEEVRAKLKRLRSGRSAAEDGEYEVRTASGETRTWSFSSTLLGSDAGGKRLIISMAADVTERKKAEEDLRKSEARFRAAFEYAAVGLAQLSLSGEMLDVNPKYCEMVGYSRREIIGRSFLDITHPDDAAESLALVERLISGDIQSYTIEKRYVRKDGTPLWVRITSSLAGAREEKSTRRISIVEDISDRKRAEQALREEDKRKDLFLATLAHELRNPLAPVRTGLELIKTGVEAGDAGLISRARQTAAQQLDQLIRLVDDLLDISRITRGKIELRSEEIDVHSIIENALETSRPAIEAGRHRLTTEVEDEPLRTRGDLLRLSQAAANLLINAAKYTPPGGDIKVSARRDGDSALIEVSDTGVGLAEEARAKIFDMFEQGGREKERQKGGLGIGLFLVRSLVELHGGTVQCSSAGLGKGSTFGIRIPAARPVALPVDSSEAKKDDGPGGCKLLVIDDNKDAANMLSLLLSSLGHDTAVAYSGPNGIAKARAWMPDAVFLDIGMPDMDGYEVARRLRKFPETKSTLLVALTGWGQEEDKRQARDAGFDHHLVKPAEAAAIQNVLQQSHLGTARKQQPSSDPGY